MNHSRRLAGGLLLALVALRAMACGGNATCGGQTLDGGLPPAEERVGALELQLTDPGLHWLGQNARLLVDLLVPGGLSFNIPESSVAGLATVCPAAGHPLGCPFTASLNEARFSRTLPATLTATLFLDIPKQDIPLNLIIGGNCNVSVEAARTPVVLDLGLSTDPITRALAVAPTVRALAGDGLTISGTGLCFAVTFFRSFLLTQIHDQFQKKLVESLEPRLCTACAATCPAPSTCGTGMLCRHASQKCVAARQGVAGQLDLAPLLGAVATERFAQIRYGFALGGRAGVSDRAVVLGGLGGAGNPDPSTCVAPTAARVRDAVPSPVLPATAPDGQPYHLGVALSRETVEDLLSAVWRAGALCLLVTSTEVAQLTSEAFTLVLPALGKLLDGRARKVLLGVRLESEPRVKVGLGTSHVDERGQRILDEPLLSVTLPGLTLELYTLVEDRTVRIGVVQQDVTLPLGLDFTPDGRAVTLLLGDATHSVTNARVLDAEILGGSAGSLAGAVPALVALALPIALRGLRPIEIPSFAGLGIVPRGVRGEPAANPTHAVIYANLKTVEPPLPGGTDGGARVDGGSGAGALHAVARTEARLQSAEPGRIELALGGRGPFEGDLLEWSFRLGEVGLWSPFTPSPRLVLDDPRLRLLGPQVVQVRARAQGRPASLDPRGVSVPVTIAERLEPTPGARPASGCTSSGGGDGLALALALAGLLASWRAGRRQR